MSSATTAGGTTPPAVTLSGTAALTYGIRIEVNDVTGGTSRGQAKFRWSIDNGATFAETGVLTAATYVLGSTGLTANFPAGTYANDNTYDAQSSSWLDLSGFNHDVSQATGGLQPLIRAGSGTPNIRFRGTAGHPDFLKSAAFTCSQPFALGMVVTQPTYTAVSSHDVWFDGVGSVARAIVTASTTAGHIWSMYAGTEVNWATTASTVAATKTFIWTEWNGASSIGRVHGSTVISGSTVGTGNISGLTLGALSDGTRSCAIDVDEVVMCSQINAIDRARWENYAALHYGI
ncbi:MAG: hypothetical protein V4529_16655 [Gemmatimonadota bacterium]